MSTTHPGDQAPSKGEPIHATTTEELIVQYLDGELVRKELETMLFERLAESAQARTLLREYLTVRGAIRSSLEDDRFQLSSELDTRTRARIEQMLEQGAAEKMPVMASRLAADAPPVRTSPVERSLNRWALRPSLALLALLLAIGTTWFVTRSTSPQLADNQPQVSSEPQPAANGLPSAPIAQVPTVMSKPVVHEVIHYVRIPVMQKVSPFNSLAQNAPAAASVQPQKQSETADPADIMISHRYAKILNAEEKHEIVVSSRDRL
jgi:negative regulator of sigma E activity